LSEPAHIEAFLRGVDAINRLDAEAALALTDESGVETDVLSAAIVEFREGRMLRYKDHADRRLALQVAGLSR